MITVEEHHDVLRLELPNLGPNSIDCLLINRRSYDVVDLRVLHLRNGRYIDRNDMTSTEEVKNRGHIQSRTTSVCAALHHEVHVVADERFLNPPCVEGILPNRMTQPADRGEIPCTPHETSKREGPEHPAVPEWLDPRPSLQNGSTCGVRKGCLERGRSGSAIKSRGHRKGSHP